MKAGSDFEHRQAEYWQEVLRQPEIHVGGKQGAKDRGDLLAIQLGLPHFGGYLTAECKNWKDLELGTWFREAAAERLNNKAVVWRGIEKVEIESPATIIIHKRHGVTAPGKQWVTTTVEEIIALITGNRNHITE